MSAIGHRLLAVGLVVLLLGATAVAVATDPDAPIRVERGGLPDDGNATFRGAVTYENGTRVGGATVVVDAAGPRLSNATPDELRAIAESAPNSSVRVVRTDADGEFELRVRPNESYRYAAVRGTYASATGRIERLTPYDSYSTLIELRRRPALDVTLGGFERVSGSGLPFAGPSGELRVFLPVSGDSARAVGPVVLEVRDLPSGWEVVFGRAEGATFDSETTRLVWDSIPSGSESVAVFRIRITRDADAGTHPFAVSLKRDTRTFDTVEKHLTTTDPHERWRSNVAALVGFALVLALLTLAAVSLRRSKYRRE